MSNPSVGDKARYAAERERVPEGWRVEWLAESPIGPVNVPRLVPYRPEDTKGAGYE